MKVYVKYLRQIAQETREKKTQKKMKLSFSSIVRQNIGHFEPYLTIRSKVFFIVSSYSAYSKVLKITYWTSVSSGQHWEIANF